MVERFLVCVDLGPHTANTVQRAVKLARPGQCVIDLLNVVPLPPGNARGNMAARQIMEKAQKARRDAAKAELDKVMATIPEPLRGQASAIDGLPADVITERAKQGYEMVVLATHGRTGLSHAILGSVAERVVRYATIPVLVVR